MIEGWGCKLRLKYNSVVGEGYGKVSCLSPGQIWLTLKMLVFSINMSSI